MNTSPRRIHTLCRRALTRAFLGALLSAALPAVAATRQSEPAKAPGPAPLDTATHVLRAMQDALLDQDRPDGNMGAANFAAKVASMSISSFTRIMVMQFDLTSLPSTNITKATLRVFCPPAGWDHSVDATFLFYAMQQPWTEGTGVGNEGSETKDGATWNTRDGIHPWEGGPIAHNRTQKSPGNFDDTPFATRTHTTYEEWLNTWIEVDATDLARAWAAGARPNCGIALCGMGLTGAGAYTMFTTREYDREGYAAGQVAPQLVVQLAATP
ncbi:MAG: DNRLRE domain-containing protein [Lentisphaerae bacterium]|nr:DNRLRE domain-containing protein [Lentisphaerota bacterium]